MLDQPTHDEKFRTLQGEETGWGYWFNTPPVQHATWTHEDWIKFIGDRWFRRNTQQQEEQAA
jgi:hypothetical protein